MFFKLETRIPEFCSVFHFAEPLKLRFEGSPAVEVLLRAATAEDRGSGSTGDAFCVILAEQEVSDEVTQAFSLMLNNEVPPGSDVAAARTTGILEEDGRIKKDCRLQRPHWPQACRDALGIAESLMIECGNKTIRSMLWRYGVRITFRPIPPDPNPLFWSLDGTRWETTPFGVNIHVPTAHAVIMSDTGRTTIEDLLKTGSQEPLAHELFREAWDRRSSARVSLVFGMAAAEVGVKEFVASCVPDATWLVEHSPTPPLIKMLKQYLPKLTTRAPLDGPVLALPPAVQNTLNKGVDLRNKVVHSQSPVVLDPVAIRDILSAVSDLLSLLDYYNGYEWALGRVRRETRDAMGLPT